MTHIGSIPFKEKFRDAVLTGKKTMTSRNKKYGDVGDTFDAFGRVFILEDVYKCTLSFVKSHFWYQEGCDSPEEFVQIWEEIHPRKGYQPNQQIWLHKWKEI